MDLYGSVWICMDACRSVKKNDFPWPGPTSLTNRFGYFEFLHSQTQMIQMNEKIINIADGSEI